MHLLLCSLKSISDKKNHKKGSCCTDSSFPLKWNTEATSVHSLCATASGAVTDHRSAGGATVEFVTLLLQQINDNYPSDTSTVITLQDQEQGERELERMKGCGPLWAPTWSIRHEIWSRPARGPALSQLHEPFLCVCVCLFKAAKRKSVWSGSSPISIHQEKTSPGNRVVVTGWQCLNSCTLFEHYFILHTCSLDATTLSRSGCGW